MCPWAKQSFREQRGNMNALQDLPTPGPYLTATNYQHFQEHHRFQSLNILLSQLSPIPSMKFF
jgi:hypothetical protein